MTLAELQRAVQSYERREKKRAQEVATHNYISAYMIGRSIASYISKDIKVPEIAEVYPTLFEDEYEKQQEQKQELNNQLSILRFKEYVTNFNKNRGGAN